MRLRKSMTKRKTARRESLRSGGCAHIPGICRIPRGAEIVLKERFFVDAAHRKAAALPELIVLANSAGYRYLSEVFRSLSRVKTRDDSNHEHFARLVPPFSPTLSDDLELRLCVFDSKIRASVLKYYGIRRSSQARGSLIPRYRAIINRARKEVGR